MYLLEASFANFFSRAETKRCIMGCRHNAELNNLEDIADIMSLHDQIKNTVESLPSRQLFLLFVIYYCLNCDFVNTYFVNLNERKRTYFKSSERMAGRTPTIQPSIFASFSVLSFLQDAGGFILFYSDSRLHLQLASLFDSNS